MNKFTKILLYAVGIFTVYSLIVTFFHMPILGGSLIFLLILACPLMMMFMMGGHNHNGHDEKTNESTHQH